MRRLGGFSCSLAMLELVASLVVDLSDEPLTVYNSDEEVVRVIPVSTGKASTPTPIFNSKVFAKPIHHDVWTHLHRSRGAVHDLCEPERGHLPPRRPLAGERREALRHAHTAMAVCACR